MLWFWLVGSGWSWNLFDGPDFSWEAVMVLLFHGLWIAFLSYFVQQVWKVDSLPLPVVCSYKGNTLNHVSHWRSAKTDSYFSVKHFIIILRSSDQELIEVPSLFVRLLNSNWGMQKVESKHWLSAGLDPGTSFLIICVLPLLFENLPGIQLHFCSKSRSVYFSTWQMYNSNFLTYVNWIAVDGRRIWYFVFRLWKALFALRI